MAYSRALYTSDGSTTQYTIPFPFLSVSTIQVRIDSILQTLGVDYTVDTATSKVVIGAAPAALTPILVKRVTPREVSDRVVVFHDPSDLNADTLNKSDLQLLFIVQEALDDIGDGIGVNDGSGGSGGPAIPTAIQDALDDINGALTTGLATANDALVAEVTNRANAVLSEHNAWVAAVLAEATSRDAAIASVKTILDDADESLASQLSVVNAQVNDPATGLAKAHALITNETTARATADTALSSRVGTLETSVPGINARLTTVEGALAGGDSNEALAYRISDLETTVNTPSTGLTARMTAEEATRSTDYAALTTRVSSLEATADLHGDSLTDITARVATEETARASSDSALAGQISTAQATANTALANVTSESATRASADAALGVRVDGVVASIGNLTTSVSTEASARATADGKLVGQYVLKVGAGGAVTGMKVTSTSDPNAGDTSEIAFQAASFKVFNGTTKDLPFYVSGGVAYLNMAFIKNASILGAHIGELEVDTLHIKGNAITATIRFSGAGTSFVKGTTKQLAKGTIAATGGGVKIDVSLDLSFNTGGSCRITVYRGTTQVGQYSHTATHGNFQTLSWFCTDTPSAGTYTYYVYVEGANDNGSTGTTKGTIEETKK